MTRKPPSIVVAHAGEIITERGLYKGDYAPDGTALDLATCPIDILAALNIAAGGGPDGELARDALNAACALADRLGLDPHASLIDSLGGWNDRADQTADAVAETCQKVAAELAGEDQ